MKTFLNVLYRRILYKIPLKFLLVLLAILAVFVASVKADYLDGLTYIGNITSNGNSVYTNTFGNIGYPDVTSLFCVYVNEGSNIQYVLNIGSTNNIRLRRANFGCFYYEAGSQNASIYITNYNGNGGVAFDFDIYMLSTDFSITSGNPGYTSLQCQTEYNLIPISSVDQNYCTTNNLCPTCQVCPSGSGSISTLYINDILHVGSPFIYMNIPEEIGRDYAYTQGGTNMFIDVEGYNVDYEAVQDIIDQQNYKPTQEDFQNIIALLGPYGEIIIFFVFLFILWAWIKKPFKSKL